jgi:carbonic anhydrase/acetyltransferase-like protein (isoleucine patch superfamily)
MTRGVVRGFGGKRPAIDPSAFVADSATVIGDVTIGAESSIWFGTVVRGDVFHVRIGAQTSIQDNAVIHVTQDRYATVVGDRVTVGHGVVLHGCTVRDLVIVGMGAIVLDQAEVGERCIVGAGALVTPGTKIPPGHLVVGAPARVKRPLHEEELEWLASSAEHYVQLTRAYRADPG